METAWVSVGAIFAFLGFVQGLLNAFLPYDLSYACKRLGLRLYNALTRYVDYTIEEYDGFKSNELYAAVQLHLSDTAASSARRVSLMQPKNAAALTCSLGEHERVLDVYKGMKIWWEFSSYERSRGVTLSWRAVPDTRRSLHMRIHRGDRDRILSTYLPHLLANAKSLKLKRRERFLYTNLRQAVYDWHDWDSPRKHWDSTPFKHPATFSSLALDPTLKQKIVEDLQDFAKGEQFYRDAGRAWKRGYLLYGPPGTGKSSMIAAMANLLEYDVYDLELTEVKSNGALRSLLLNTSDKAIIVIEDIDCSLDLSDRKKKKKKNASETESGADALRPKDDEEASKVTMSGLLNFTDGLWSSCGSERIFVFTTNHIEKLDVALLRRGRMDMHIHLSYCGFEAFKVLAKNYLKLEEHELFEEVKAAMQEEGVRMTPADVSEVMTREKRDVQQALACLIKELRESKNKKPESKGEGEEGEEEEEDPPAEEVEEEKVMITKAKDKKQGSMEGEHEAEKEEQKLPEASTKPEEGGCKG